MPRTKGTTATNKASKTKLKSTKPTESNITETPKYSEVVLNYCRNGNLGFSTVHETVDISFNQKEIDWKDYNTIPSYKTNGSMQRP